MNQRLLCLLMLTLCAGTAMGQSQGPRPEKPRLEVAVKRIDLDALHLYDVDAHGVVKAPLASVWRTLTQYEKMDEFVPDLASCRVLSRNGNEVIIEQIGTARFLFMAKAIRLVVRATENPMTSIDIALISGDMKHYESRWELFPIPETGGTRIVYSGKLIPNFYVPGMIGAQMVRADIERMLAAVLVRIDSRREP